MEFWKEESKNLPVLGTYDVIVAGSGPAGMAAAVTAGRCGCKVLLIEAGGTLGGISTSGLMSHFTGSVSCPLYDETLRRAAAKDPFPALRPFRGTIDPEQLKQTYFEMAEEAHVELLLYTLVCDAIVEDGKIIGVICQNKTGRCVYRASAFADGTGDGDLAAKAGARFFIGREEDGAMQPATLMFKVAGVDTDCAVFPGSFETTVPTEKGELQALARRILPSPIGHVLLYRSTLPGVVTCNMTNVTGIDGTKAEDLTRAETICRSQIGPIIDFLREYAPGYERCYLLCAAALMGIRETRHFYGVETITEKDILAAKVFDNWVVKDAHFNFDVHNITGAGLDKTGQQKDFPQPQGYTIPLGCLVPEAINGLALSGRCISGTHMAHSNFRVMPICFGIGAAAGAVAAISAQTNREIRDVTAKEVRDIVFES